MDDVEIRVRLRCRDSDDIDRIDAERAETVIPPWGQGGDERPYRGELGVMGDGDGGEIGIARRWRDFDEVEQARLDTGEPAAVVNIEKRGIDEGVDAAEGNLERGEFADRHFGLTDEFLEPFVGDIAAVAGSLGQETELLHGNVQEGQRMYARVGQCSERGADVIQLGAEYIGRDANAAEHEIALVGAPFRSVVPTIRDIGDLPQVLPDTPVGFVLLRGDIGQPPEGVTPFQEPPRGLAGELPVREINQPP